MSAGPIKMKIAIRDILPVRRLAAIAFDLSVLSGIALVVIIYP